MSERFFVLWCHTVSCGRELCQWNVSPVIAHTHFSRVSSTSSTCGRLVYCSPNIYIYDSLRAKSQSKPNSVMYVRFVGLRSYLLCDILVGRQWLRVSPRALFLWGNHSLSIYQAIQMIELPFAPPTLPFPPPNRMPCRRMYAASHKAESHCVVVSTETIGGGGRGMGELEHIKPPTHMAHKQSK